MIKPDFKLLGQTRRKGEGGVRAWRILMYGWMTALSGFVFALAITGTPT